MLVDRFYVKAAPVVAGTWSANTQKRVGCYVNQVLVKATTPATVFDVRIEDLNDTIIRRFTNNTVILNDLTAFPVEGVITIIIYGSDSDEDFEVLMVFAE